MLYSRIVSVEVFNFMVYKHAKMSFDERNIINLKGYNSSGKSTMLRAIAIAFNDDLKQKQTKLIRFGEDYFRIIVEFDDCVKIVRDKYINGQSLYEMYKDGELIFTTREGNRLSRVDTVPKVIKDYLGLCVLEDGWLNYQARKGKLWLVETKGSENYYSLNEALKTEYIARANTLLNSDKNKLGADITEIEAELNKTEILLQGTSAVTDELVSALIERESYAKEILDRLNAITNISNTAEKLVSLREVPEVSTISSEGLSDISRLVEAVNRLEGLRVAPSIEGINAERVVALDRLGSVASRMAGMQCIGNEVMGINAERLAAISKVSETLSRVVAAVEDGKRLEKEYKSASDKLRMAADAARRVGKKFVKCTNCGAYMEVGDTFA